MKRRITFAACLLCAMQVSIALPNTTDSTRTATPPKPVPAKPADKTDTRVKKAVPQYQWFYIVKPKKDNC